MYTEKQLQHFRDRHASRYGSRKNWIRSFAWWFKIYTYNDTWGIVWLEHYEYTIVNKNTIERRPIYKKTKKRKW